MDVRARIRQARLDRWARLAAAGDRAAFRRLYAVLYPFVASYVARRVPVREDAEDLVSRTFEKLLASLGAIDPAKGGSRAWVIGIARNAIVDHRRTRKPSSPIEPFAEVIAAAGDGAEVSIEKREREAAVREAIARLPEDVQELVSLRFGEDLSWREIAAVTGGTDVAVRQRVSRALRELKASFAGTKMEELLPCVD